MMKSASPDAMLRRADAADAQRVFDLVQETIREVYPLYYPEAVVRFFSELHCLAAVSADIDEGCVVVAEADGAIVGTGTLDGSHVTRVFVSPVSQGRGVGTLLLGELEAQAATVSGTTVLDSSLPAARFYEHRGYAVRSHEEYEVRGDDGGVEAVLVYAVMEKPLR